MRSYIRKKPAVKTAGGTSQDGVLMATMRCARRHARGHRLQRFRQRVGLLVNLYSVPRLCQYNIALTFLSNVDAKIAGFASLVHKLPHSLDRSDREQARTAGAVLVITIPSI